MNTATICRIVDSKIPNKLYKLINEISRANTRSCPGDAIAGNARKRAYSGLRCVTLLIHFQDENDKARPPRNQPVCHPGGQVWRALPSPCSLLLRPACRVRCFQ